MKLLLLDYHIPDLDSFAVNSFLLLPVAGLDLYSKSSGMSTARAPP
jgi:hypothetical protein